jgi:hypothetical protein
MIRPAQSPRELVGLMCREFGWTMEYAYTRTIEQVLGEDGILRGKPELSMARRNWIRNNRDTVIENADGTWERPSMARLVKDSEKAEARMRMRKTKIPRRR